MDKTLSWQKRDTPVNSSLVAGLAGRVTAATDAAHRGVIE